MRTRGLTVAASLLLPCGLVVAGCGSTGASSEPVEVAPPVQPAASIPAAEPTEPEIEPIEEPPAAAATEANDPVQGAYGPRTVVIEGEAPPESDRRSLMDAARAARAEREGTGSATAVITDETLAEYATGELSIAEKPAGDPPKVPPSATSGENAGKEPRGEAYWRDRVRAERTAWRDLFDETVELESEIARLRREFYAEDDGYYRDSQIKPAWDRALDRLAEIREEIVHARETVFKTLEEGRLAGALPGWLREAIDLEPEELESEDDLEDHEITEPVVLDETGDGGVG